MWKRPPTTGLQQLPEERKALAERYTIDADEAQRREQTAAAEAARRAAEEEAARQAAVIAAGDPQVRKPLRDRAQGERRAADLPLVRHRIAEPGHSLSGCGLAARIESCLEGPAHELARHVARAARNRLRLHPGDADDLAAPLAVTARVRVLLADRRGLGSPPATEEREEPREHSTSVAESSGDA